MLDTKDSSGSVDDEIGGVQMVSLNKNNKSELPPLYIDIQEDIENNLKDCKE